MTNPTFLAADQDCAKPRVINASLIREMTFDKLTGWLTRSVIALIVGSFFGFVAAVVFAVVHHAP